MPTTITKTVKPTGGDYTTLAAAVAAENNGYDYGTTDTNKIILVYALAAPEDVSTTSISISGGLNVDATHNLTIYAMPDTNGVWNSSLCYVVSGALTVVSNSQDFTRIVGLQVECRGTGTFCGSGIDARSHQGVSIERCIVRSVYAGSGSSDPGHGIWIIDSTGASRAINNTVYGFTCAGAFGITFNDYAGGLLANNTVSKCDVGISGGVGFETAQNNVVFACTTHAWVNGTWATATNNASDDGTHPGTSGQTGTPLVVNTTTGSEDFHLQAGDTVCRGHGVNLSGTFTIDIDGQTRTAPWDIGSDQYVAAGLPAAVYDYYQNYL